MSAARKIIVPPPPLVALAGWLVPGLGYWIIGQRARGVTVGLTILLMFVGGLLIGGVRTIDSALIESQAQLDARIKDDQAKTNEIVEQNKHLKQGATPLAAYQAPSIMVRTLQKPWFIGQALTGPVALASGYLGATWGGEAGAPFAHARVYEIGVLYTAVAGMLNLMAVIDAAYRASNQGDR